VPKKAWRRVTWREGTNTKRASRFAAVRVRPAHRDYKRSTPRPEEWFLIEWPADEPEPTKYFLSTLPETISRRALAPPRGYAGGSSGTTRTSSRNADLVTTKGEAGGAFIITRHCASPLMDPYSPKGERFPPQDHATPFSSKTIPDPEVTDPADLPIRPERHVPNSLTSVRIAIARAISRILPRCPCCHRTTRRMNL
jgi:hypothetical protein